MAIQLARYLGAHVTTTVSADDAVFAAGLGAEEVIDYKHQRFDAIVHDMDAVLDTVGGDTYVQSYKVLKRGGRLLSMLEQPREDLMRDYGVEAVYQFTRATTERLARLAALVDQGTLKVHVHRTFPLEQAAEALQNDPTRGKIVIKIA